MPSRPPLPVCRAVLLADMILTEAGSHKKSLIGVYSRIAVPLMPFRRILHAYVQLGDAGGEYFFAVELAHLATGDLLHQAEMGPIRAEDRLAPLEIVLHIPVQFEEFGEYELRMLFDGHVFASRIFSVVPPPERPGEPGEPLPGEEN